MCCLTRLLDFLYFCHTLIVFAFSPKFSLCSSSYLPIGRRTMEKLKMNEILYSLKYDYDETDPYLDNNAMSWNSRQPLKCLSKSNYSIDAILKDPFKKPETDNEQVKSLENLLARKFWENSNFIIDNIPVFGADKGKKIKSYVPILNYLIKKRRPTSQPSLCNFCGKTFTRPWLLQGHVRTHTGERPFKCNICEKTFADKSNLRAHIQTHSTIKPFQCCKCCRSFSLKSYLAKHKASSCGKKINKCSK